VPSERPRQRVIILNCDNCGVDPNRTITSIWIVNRNNAHGLQIENKNYANKYGMTTAVLVGAVNILEIQTVGMKELWVEKYRPNTVDGYVFVDDSQRQQVQSWIKDGTIPHLLFSGSPGTGKTTLAKLLINELGVDEYDVMFANGSKEARKIEWVDKLITFCQTMPFGKFKVCPD
jgi:hypothetical protein